MVPTPPPNPLAWLLIFAALSIGATVASARHLLDGPRTFVSQVVAPLEAGANRVGHVLADLGQGWQEINRLRAENAALRRTVDNLLQEAVQLRSADLENRDLREQLHYAQSHREQEPVAAEVIARDSSTLLGYAVIDRGGVAHLVDGMTVLAPAGLVGRIVALSDRTATVLLINHPSSSVNSVIQGTPGATGVVNGRPDGRLDMRYIPQSEPVKVNDLVVTSGLGGAFPKDILIGRVVHVGSRDIDMFQQAIVEPFVNFHKLSQVLVVTGFVPAKL